jgi:hypothetical protein
MSLRTVQSHDRSTRGAWRERTGVLALAAGIISVVAVYLALNAATGTDDAARRLLPYQTLARTLPEADQQLFTALRSGLLTAEAERARTSAWPDASALAARGIAPFSSSNDAGGYQWTRFQQGAITNYFGQPRDPSAAAWLLEIQEPEPGMLPDPAPTDDEHHRLPDGTVLHIYVWMHRFGGQVPAGFVRQPQVSGWVEVFAAPPDPAFYNRR